MSGGVKDPEATKLRLQMMLSKGFFPNPDGSLTEVSETVAAQMLRDIDQGKSGPGHIEDDGLDYDVPVGP